MTLRVRQALVVAAGLLAAAIMGTLGLWQAQRSAQVGDQAIAARAAEAPVPLLDWIRTDGTVGDIYGKPVSVSGTYLAGQQLWVVSADGTARVLTALQIPDGRVVPVVRGVGAIQGGLPAPPSGTQTATGLFLPGEGDEPTPVSGDALASVRMPLLAQRWPQQVTPGFVTLDAAGAAAQGLAPAAVTLPHGEKSLQNGSYAIQWWIFGAFALILAARLAYGLGERERAAREAAALEAAGTVETAAQDPSGAGAGRREDD